MSSQQQRQTNPRTTSAILADSLDDIKPYLDTGCTFCFPVLERAQRERVKYFGTLKELTDLQRELLQLRELISTGVRPQDYDIVPYSKDYHVQQEQMKLVHLKRLIIQLNHELKTLALYTQQARKYTCCDCFQVSFNQAMTRSPRRLG